MADDIEYFDPEDEIDENNDGDDIEIDDDQLQDEEEPEYEIGDEKDEKDEKIYDIGDQDDVDDDTDTLEFFLAMKQNKTLMKTTDRLSKYEKAAIIGYRSQQIAEGAKPYVMIGGICDSSVIAEKEFAEGKIPYYFDRPIPSNKIGKFVYEKRRIGELFDYNHNVGT